MTKRILPLIALIVCLISCKNNENAESVTALYITPNAAFMEVGDILTLTTNVSGNIAWSSSDTAVAIVQDGIVQAKNDGHAVITAVLNNATAKADMYVTQKGGMYLGDYELVWEENFDGSELDTASWTIEQGGGGWGNNEQQYYTNRAENIRLKDGCLEIEARKETYNNREYTSARIKSEKKRDFAYGKMEARIKLPSGRGTWPAFWMKGNGSWPKKGEIDIMEHVGSQPNMVSHAVHTTNKNGTKGNNWSSRYYGESSMEGEFHVFGIEWVKCYTYQRDAIKFFVDGKQTAIVLADKAEEDIDSWPFFDKEFFIINLALGGSMGGSINNDIFDDPTNNPVIMYVDWVRVYQKQM